MLSPHHMTTLLRVTHQVLVLLCRSDHICHVFTLGVGLLMEVQNAATRSGRRMIEMRCATSVELRVGQVLVVCVQLLHRKGRNVSYRFKIDKKV